MSSLEPDTDATYSDQFTDNGCQQDPTSAYSSDSDHLHNDDVNSKKLSDPSYSDSCMSTDGKNPTEDASIKKNSPAVSPSSEKTKKRRKNNSKKSEVTDSLQNETNYADDSEPDISYKKNKKQVSGLKLIESESAASKQTGQTASLHLEGDTENIPSSKKKKKKPKKLRLVDSETASIVLTDSEVPKRERKAKMNDEKSADATLSDLVGETNSENTTRVPTSAEDLLKRESQNYSSDVQVVLSTDQQNISIEQLTPESTSYDVDSLDQNTTSNKLNPERCSNTAIPNNNEMNAYENNKQEGTATPLIEQQTEPAIHSGEMESSDDKYSANKFRQPEQNSESDDVGTVSTKLQSESEKTSNTSRKKKNRSSRKSKDGTNEDVVNGKNSPDDIQQSSQKIRKRKKKSQKSDTKRKSEPNEVYTNTPIVLNIGKDETVQSADESASQLLHPTAESPTAGDSPVGDECSSQKSQNQSDYLLQHSTNSELRDQSDAHQQRDTTEENEISSTNGERLSQENLHEENKNDIQLPQEINSTTRVDQTEPNDDNVSQDDGRTECENYPIINSTILQQLSSNISNSTHSEDKKSLDDQSPDTLQVTPADDILIMQSEKNYQIKEQLADGTSVGQTVSFQSITTNEKPSEQTLVVMPSNNVSNDVVTTSKEESIALEVLSHSNHTAEDTQPDELQPRYLNNQNIGELEKSSKSENTVNPSTSQGDECSQCEYPIVSGITTDVTQLSEELETAAAMESKTFQLIQTASNFADDISSVSSTWEGVPTVPRESIKKPTSEPTQTPALSQAPTETQVSLEVEPSQQSPETRGGLEEVAPQVATSEAALLQQTLTEATETEVSSDVVISESTPSQQPTETQGSLKEVTSEIATTEPTQPHELPTEAVISPKEVSPEVVSSEREPSQQPPAETGSDPEVVPSESTLSQQLPTETQGSLEKVTSEIATTEPTQPHELPTEAVISPEEVSPEVVSSEREPSQQPPAETGCDPEVVLSESTLSQQLPQVSSEDVTSEREPSQTPTETGSDPGVVLSESTLSQQQPTETQALKEVTSEIATTEPTQPHELPTEAVISPEEVSPGVVTSELASPETEGSPEIVPSESTLSQQLPTETQGSLEKVTSEIATTEPTQPHELPTEAVISPEEVSPGVVTSELASPETEGSPEIVPSESTLSQQLPTETQGSLEKVTSEIATTEPTQPHELPTEAVISPVEVSPEVVSSEREPSQQPPAETGCDPEVVLSELTPSQQPTETQGSLEKVTSEIATTEPTQPHELPTEAVISPEEVSPEVVTSELASPETEGSPEIVPSESTLSQQLPTETHGSLKEATSEIATTEPTQPHELPTEAVISPEAEQPSQQLSEGSLEVEFQITKTRPAKKLDSQVRIEDPILNAQTGVLDENVVEEKSSDLTHPKESTKTAINEVIIKSINNISTAVGEDVKLNDIQRGSVKTDDPKHNNSRSVRVSVGDGHPIETFNGNTSVTANKSPRIQGVRARLSGVYSPLNKNNNPKAKSFSQNNEISRSSLRKKTAGSDMKTRFSDRKDFESDDGKIGLADSRKSFLKVKKSFRASLADPNIIHLNGGRLTYLPRGKSMIKKIKKTNSIISSVSTEEQPPVPVVTPKRSMSLTAFAEFNALVNGVDVELFDALAESSSESKTDNTITSKIANNEHVGTVERRRDHLIDIYKDLGLQPPKKRLGFGSSTEPDVTTMNTEVNRLLKIRNNTLDVLRSIEIREESVNCLKEFSNTFSFYKRFYRPSVVKRTINKHLSIIREATKLVMNAVQIWQGDVGTNAPFYWKEENYVQKISSDLQFLNHSPLLPYIDIGIQNNPLLHATPPNHLPKVPARIFKNKLFAIRMAAPCYSTDIQSSEYCRNCLALGSQTAPEKEKNRVADSSTAFRKKKPFVATAAESTAIFGEDSDYSDKLQKLLHSTSTKQKRRRLPVGNELSPKTKYWIRVMYSIHLVWRACRMLLVKVSERAAASKIQNFYRRSLAARMLIRLRKEREASIVLQKWIKGVLTRKTFVIEYARFLAARCAQMCWRCYYSRKERRYLKARLSACVKIQTLWRKVLAVGSVKRLHKRYIAALRIQRRAKRYLATKEVAWRKMILKATMIIQRSYLNYSTRRNITYRTLRARAAGSVQRHWRGYQGRQKAWKVSFERNAIIRIQCWWRCHDSKRLLSTLRRNDNAAQLIQRRWRCYHGVRICKALRAISIQNRNQYLEEAITLEDHRAALIIQTTFRKTIYKRIVMNLIKMERQKVEDHLRKERNHFAVVIQCAARKMFANRNMRLLRLRLLSAFMIQRNVRRFLRRIRICRNLNAVKVQVMWHNYCLRVLSRASVRKKTNQRELRLQQVFQNEAATTIQAIWRGVSSRKTSSVRNKLRRVLRKEMFESENRIPSSILIQSVFRMSLCRRLLRRLKLVRDTAAACIIQSVWKGIQTRRTVSVLLIERCRNRTAAAVRLQTLWRCYLEASTSKQKTFVNYDNFSSYDVHV